MKKIILITNIPSPYRLPLWDEIKKLTTLRVICIAKNEKNRHWQRKNRTYISFLKTYHLFFSDRDWAVHFSLPFLLFLKLIKQSPDAIIITGYDSFQYWEALLYAVIFKKNKILWNGSTLLSSRSSNKLINKMKATFIQSFDAYYTYGTQASKYLQHFGAIHEKIVTGINTVNTHLYKKSIIKKQAKSNNVKFLYVGQLIKRKGLNNTIKALAKTTQTNWQLTIVGSGVEETSLKELVKSYKLSDKIFFVGFKQPEETINFYQTADVFLMPSYNEVWGLVVNEALASGLFCLSSKYAGVSFDLIKEGENGYLIDPKNIDDIANKIERTFTLDLDKNAISRCFDVYPEQEALKIMQAVAMSEKI